MDGLILFCAIIIIGLIVTLSFRRHSRGQAQGRVNVIESYAFPQKISTVVTEKYPHLGDNDVGLVIEDCGSIFMSVTWLKGEWCLCRRKW